MGPAAGTPVGTSGGADVRRSVARGASGYDDAMAKLAPPVEPAAQGGGLGAVDRAPGRGAGGGGGGTPSADPGALAAERAGALRELAGVYRQAAQEVSAYAAHPDLQGLMLPVVDLQREADRVTMKAALFDAAATRTRAGMPAGNELPSTDPFDVSDYMEQLQVWQRAEATIGGAIGQLRARADAAADAAQDFANKAQKILDARATNPHWREDQACLVEEWRAGRVSEWGGTVFTFGDWTWWKESASPEELEAKADAMVAEAKRLRGWADGAEAALAGTRERLRAAVDGLLPASLRSPTAP